MHASVEYEGPTTMKAPANMDQKLLNDAHIVKKNIKELVQFLDIYRWILDAYVSVYNYYNNV